MKPDKKIKLITLVESDQLFYILLNPGGTQTVVHQEPVEQFLNLELDKIDIPHDSINKTNSLLIVPDYWLGNNYYSFLSKKTSIVVPFIERKLKTEVAGFEEIDDFYDYTFFKESEREQKLHAFFLQDATAYALYHRFSELCLSPIRITTPAFLWQKKLASLYEDFSSGGKGLIHLEDQNCYLYFFHMGQSLFSRRISLPETAMDREEKINLLNYEVNQSFYLFSQKTKTSVNAIYFQSVEREITDFLSESLNKKLIVCEEDSNNNLSKSSQNIIPDILAPFTAKEISPDESFLSISYKPLKRELEWCPIQKMGIAVGVFLLVLLFGEAIFLKTLSNHGLLAMTFANSRLAENPKQALRQYSEAIDKVIENRLRPSLSKMMINLCSSLPDQVSIKNASLTVDSPSKMIIEANIVATGPEDFKKVLSVFLGNINHGFKTNNPLAEKDIDIYQDPANTSQQNQQYTIKFRVELL